MPPPPDAAMLRDFVYMILICRQDMDVTRCLFERCFTTRFATLPPLLWRHARAMIPAFSRLRCYDIERLLRQR